MRLLIAGGGTGGHLFPGVALAEELRARESDAPVLFVGTDRGIEARVLPELGWDLEKIEISGLKTVGIRGALRGALRIPRAMWQSRAIIRRFEPDVVVGVGGYASGPAVLMARLMGVPTAILEQNSIPGLANKILGRFVRAVFLAFEETRRFFKARKILMTGNPIRAQIRAALSAGAEEREGPPRVFIFGGSQGAARVNELCSAAAALLRERGIEASYVHQTGAKTLEATEARYREAGIDARCSAFINDMASEYRRADLIIARSGATTVAELGVVGRPAILIPYPYAADNHQEINAQELAEGGAAVLLREAELSPETLADAMAELLTNPEARERMGSAMKALGRPDAAAQILDWCEEQVH
jgi:UDP-N-acetylglucosamine--N-acetylmuramyl-(pentapeptide) pyrophosphoryl-undecaprenol N-acetylglucosamine transferase